MRRFGAIVRQYCNKHCCDVGEVVDCDEGNCVEAGEVCDFLVCWEDEQEEE